MLDTSRKMWQSRSGLQVVLVVLLLEAKAGRQKWGCWMVGEIGMGTSKQHDAWAPVHFSLRRTLQSGHACQCLAMHLHVDKFMHGTLLWHPPHASDVNPAKAIRRGRCPSTKQYTELSPGVVDYTSAVML